MLLRITKIEKQIHNNQRFSVFINDQFAFGLDGVQLLYHKLEEGQELSKKSYDKIMNETVFQKAKDRALKYLSYRARSKKEIYNKLNEKNMDFSIETIESVIEFLEKYQYINDYEFAGMYARDAIRLKKLGSVRIKHELKQKGVDEKIIDQIIDDLYQSGELDETENAVFLLKKRYKSKSIKDLTEKKKAHDFLLRKGFDFETIHLALKIFLEQVHDDY